MDAGIKPRRDGAGVKVAGLGLGGNDGLNCVVYVASKEVRYFFDKRKKIDFKDSYDNGDIILFYHWETDKLFCGKVLNIIQKFNEVEAYKVVLLNELGEFVGEFTYANRNKVVYLHNYVNLDKM